MYRFGAIKGDFFFFKTSISKLVLWYTYDEKITGFQNNPTEKKVKKIAFKQISEKFIQIVYFFDTMNHNSKKKQKMLKDFNYRKVNLQRSVFFFFNIGLPFKIPRIVNSPKSKRL